MPIDNIFRNSNISKLELKIVKLLLHNTHCKWYTNGNLSTNNKPLLRASERNIVFQRT